MRYLQISAKRWVQSRESLLEAIDQSILRIVVPTMNSESYIDIVLSYYQQIGVPVTVVIDAKSKDDTQRVAKANAADVSVLSNPSTVVEGMIQTLSDAANSQWVLRIDDDELPSLAMLACVSQVIRHAQVAEKESICAVAFARKQCAVTKTGTLMASRLHSQTDHQQWRLYRPDQMQYTNEVHTAGFMPAPELAAIAPTDCFMVHLDWSLHDYQSRLDKVTRYDEHTAGKGSMWRNFYLYEDDPNHGLSQFERIRAPEFKSVCRLIADRLPQNCIAEPSGVDRMIGYLQNRLKTKFGQC